MVNFEKTLREERAYLAKNEPTFYQEGASGNVYVGKVGRLPTGEDIRLRIELPEFYPVVRPTVSVVPIIDHPNVNPNGRLDLLILDQWEPTYRLKDIIGAARRLFIHSKIAGVRRSQPVQEIRTAPQPSTPVDNEMITLQAEIATLKQQLAELETQSRKKQEVFLQSKGMNPLDSQKIDPLVDMQAELQALDDLLLLLNDKFEEAEIDQTDFFRLFKHYTARRFTVAELLKEQQGGTEYVISNKEKTKEPIRS